MPVFPCASATWQMTRATRVIVADPPPAIDAKVIVRELPDRPQTPPPVALQETNCRVAGSSSSTTRFRAPVGRSFLTTMDRMVFSLDPAGDKVSGAYP